MNIFPALISNSDLTLFDAGRESSGFEYTSSCPAKTPVLQVIFMQFFFFLTFDDSLKKNDAWRLHLNINIKLLNDSKAK